MCNALHLEILIYYSNKWLPHVHWKVVNNIEYVFINISLFQTPTIFCFYWNKDSGLNMYINRKQGDVHYATQNLAKNVLDEL